MYTKYYASSDKKVVRKNLSFREPKRGCPFVHKLHLAECQRNVQIGGQSVYKIPAGIRWNGGMGWSVYRVHILGTFSRYGQTIFHQGLDSAYILGTVLTIFPLESDGTEEWLGHISDTHPGYTSLVYINTGVSVFIGLPHPFQMFYGNL